MKKFIIETSARHAHVTNETLEILFGKGAELTVKKMLSQPGQYASEQKIQVVGPRGSLTCTILGPTRPSDQVELSFTDARTIGVIAPVRESGDIKGSSGCKLVGPCGEVEIKEGVIIAKRHIHMTPHDAEEMKVKDKDIVSVEIVNETGRGITLHDTVVRVHPNFALAMHIDTDEANAGALVGSVMGKIIK